jgi:L-lactate permease
MARDTDRLGRDLRHRRVWVWNMPLDQGLKAYIYGVANGVWSVDWITFWGVVLFNTLLLTGVFERFRRWLVARGTMDERVQTLLFAWAFGALLEIHCSNCQPPSDTWSPCWPCCRHGCSFIW